LRKTSAQKRTARSGDPFLLCFSGQVMQKNMTREGAKDDHAPLAVIK
jgi:hypothetical protein